MTFRTRTSSISPDQPLQTRRTHTGPLAESHCRQPGVSTGVLRDTDGLDWVVGSPGSYGVGSGRKSDVSTGVLRDPGGGRGRTGERFGLFTGCWAGSANSFITIW